mmetsp:Transcript_46260/g.83354  ORF Transcript_46260/g.83354 Transcript_46260/m.83354 type:complete len:802 (+) Transcript_46260:70-2475(+)|eukprot:CAMPEP_0197700192 /NCGR_PEP_ID=MMETSP1338-20131121/121652_1 /TAXON_ID=43686 ORGANISM="Pelagodinium beii, Strain RCC1491" /NCGR_SAMPLE_ID=MMETSP1338 /ASSEMBLY_ACC=CAM_ASM_000754 /LENGTH=801 /DNA_ID=CAMNT_0043283771 /DNA_START=1 /DNA_END=2406 /DNA_ORIENTATION=+
MGSGSSRKVYANVPEETEAYVHPAESFDKKSSPSRGKRPKPGSSTSAEEEVNLPGPPSPVRVKVGSRKSKENAQSLVNSEATSSQDVSKGGIVHQKPRTFTGSAPGPQLLVGQAQPIPQPQPLHQRRVQLAEPAMPVVLPKSGALGLQTVDEQPLVNVQTHTEKFMTEEMRKDQEKAAMEAIRAALPPSAKRPAPDPQQAPLLEGRRNVRAADVPKATAARQDPLMQIASMQASRAVKRESKPRFSDNVRISIDHKKVLLHWVKLGRRRVRAKEKYAAVQKPARSKRKKPLKVDQLVELYLENQEELEKMMFEEPKELILSQIELLTMRIEELDDEVERERKRKQAEMIGKLPHQEEVGVSQAKAAADARKEEAEKRNQQEVWDWGTAFDMAVAERDAWKKSRGEREKEAQDLWRSKVVATWPAPAPAKDVQKLGKTDVVEQMKSERENLEALLARFEAQKRRQNRQEEQPMIDLAEALQEEQREAMAQRARELREQRQLEAEERKRQQEEAEERRRQAEEERQRRAEEERRQKQLREEEERRRREREAEEAELLRREEEERELERLRREKKESERKRAEERRLAEEREATRRREIEERRRQEEERLAAERKARIEEEEQQRQREEEENMRAEQERRRIEQERRQEEDLKQRRAIARQALMMSAFDELEDACQEDDEEEREDDLTWEEAIQAVQVTEPPETTFPEMTLEAPAAPVFEEPEEPPRSSAPSQSPTGTGADWMTRALEALVDGDSDEESDEEGGEQEEGEAEHKPSESERIATDMQLIKLNKAITRKIDEIHGD